jgi:hypothetical protein
MLELLGTIGLGTVGFFVGTLLFARVGRWIATMYEISKGPGGEAKGVRLGSAAFLSDGPWLLFVVIFSGIHLRAEPWALAISVGIAVAIAFFGAYAFFLARKARLSDHKDAA